jgi:hypothetical protein
MKHAWQNYCSHFGDDVVSLDSRIFTAEFDGPIDDRQPQRERYAAAREDWAY